MPNLDNLVDIFREFTWSSVLDVALLAALIFATLRLFSGTRAITQLRGAIGLILLAVVLGRAFDLTAINYLVEHSFTALLIGAAVVFQPEIRRGLDRIGRAGVPARSAAKSRKETIGAVVEASTRMSSERHGGLFVIERSTGLQDVIETGVPVDARVSPELLTGIFYPNSPLHDMAVVLRDDRVVAAGCILPLADLEPGDRAFGTRHRAAIGITEQTDALTVVVSEETGDVSVGLGGKLTPVSDARRLTAVLEWLLDGGQPAPEAATLAGIGR